jgi:hypothetical protein
MKKILNFILFIIIGVMAFLSCEKAESYSEIPYIEFTSYRVYDTAFSSGFFQRNVAVNFSFVDGDGDIGYNKELTGDSAKNNLFFSRYEQRNGEFINVDSLLVDSIRYSIPYAEVMSREGQNKTIKGSIKVDVSELVINYDTIKYDFYIIDRAGNKSNITTTTPIVGLKNQE